MAPEDVEWPFVASERLNNADHDWITDRRPDFWQAPANF